MLATIASISAATRIKNYLMQEKNISVKVIQTPSPLTKDGCGYSLRFPDKAKQSVAEAAGLLKINIRSYFKESSENGDPVYIKV